MRSTLKCIFIIFTLIFTNSVLSQSAPDNVKNSDTYQIGEMVQSLQVALEVRDEASQQAIRLYGTDSRYYSMIRGWLFQELVGVESQLHASKDETRIEELQAHSDFLKNSIRLIDLE